MGKFKIRTISKYSEEIEAHNIEQLVNELLQMPYVAFVDYNVIGMVCGFDENCQVVATAEEIKDN